VKSKFYSRLSKIAGPFVRFLFRIKYHGVENEPDEKDGSYVLICNHISNADPVFLCASGTKQQPHFMAKKELFKIPILRKLIAALGAYPVNRSGADVSAIKNTIKMLEEGKSIGIFPQGHREKGIRPHDANLKNGAAMIACRAKAMVLPCCIITKKNKFALFRRIDVYYGKPISFEELGYDPDAPGEYARITGELFGKVCELYEIGEKERGKKR